MKLLVRRCWGNRHGTNISSVFTIYNILSDPKKFAKTFVVDEKNLHPIFGIKKKLTYLLKELET